MSISGPCVWLSSLSPPATSHLSAITNHLPSTSWNSEQVLLRSRVNPPRLPYPGEKGGHSVQKPAVDMQPNAVLKAENVFSATSPVATSNHVRSSEAEMPPPKEAESRSTEETLSRMGLDQLNHSESHPSGVSKPASPSAPKASTLEAKKRPQEEARGDEKDDDEAMGISSDEGGDQKNSSDAKTDKKKMKRFRLTHNQTRFLMSEFTRQAHPDAAHRERLSREIPGLTPRQVQVWFQNRRAKLKRLTSNDRERMLKSRALPDDFDTTQVLRTPFDNKTLSETPVASPRNYMATGTDSNSLKMLLTDGLQRINEDEYVVSPLSSSSTTGNCFPSAGPDRTPEQFSQHGLLGPRPAATLPELQRNTRGTFPFPRSSSFSEVSFSTGLHLPGRFSRPGVEPLNHPGLPYARRPMDYGIPRPANGMVVGYDHSRPMEGSVSPTGQQEQPLPYNVDNHNQQVPSYQTTLTMPAPKGYGSIEMNSHMQPRHMPALHSIPVSDAPDYRPFSYEHHPYSMQTGIPYSQANASSMSLPASFPPDTTHVPQVAVSTEDRINQSPQILDPLRGKFGNPSYDYAGYM
ncbi:hypothetical protein Aspvir_003544 [Aspergillus viridinutans]|uniref:Homeobox domain-containing protein n=1 Tax=Aspergillus viridinutans TaxID=75553 RepID=A0A9P3F7B9_ASPVI|nr:uncharacterized protein Aspvir_003544 [Aspergillus viridinutans]GIK07874.1 hypothetical protein Aspvir_003544 [Aspergillus viridinutans]